EFMLEDPWAPAVAEYVLFDARMTDGVTALEVLRAGLQMQHPPSQQDKIRVANILRRLKWRARKARSKGGPPLNRWFPPSTAVPTVPAPINKVLENSAEVIENSCYARNQEQGGPWARTLADVDDPAKWYVARRGLRLCGRKSRVVHRYEMLRRD